MSLFDELDLGAEDYSQEKPSGLGQFTSKPSPRPYQPFGGPIQQAPQTYAAPQYYEQPQTPEPQNYNVFSDDELDTYERAKKDYSYINQYSSAASQIANKRKSAYDDFKKNKLLPFFEQSGGFGDFDDDDELAAAIDEMEAAALKTSQMEDGWLGPSDEKIAAGESLKNFKLWSSPNGLRDQYRRLRAERDQYQGIADSYKNQKMQRLEQLTNIPIPAREALDEALKSRGKSPGSKKKMNELLDGMSWEEPVVGYDGEVQNLESVDPRTKINPAIGYDGQGNQSSKAQRERVAAAMRGDVRGVLSRRKHIARERQLRDKGFFFSESGLLDGRPIGLSRRDVDLLDIDDMRKAGMTSYQGRPLDEAMAELGGEERLEMAKVMESVYSAKSNYEDAQLAFLKVAGGSGAEKAREKMEAARDDMQKTIGLAASYGLDNELFEQAETTGWLSGIGNAIKRGMLMSEMSNYTPDFLTNTLDADEMQRFIEIASEMEKLPTSSTMKRVKETKSDGFLDAMGNLLFDNPAAIPEMFVESLSSFLPSTIKWLIPSAATGAAIGSVIPGAGTAAGAALGARASWGAASFVLEASGMALEGMQELNIDWKNPKVFAAAWTNESIRSKIQKKMVQKGVPIAIADTLTGMMAGKVMGVVNHTGNAVFKGGKLLNKEAFNKAAGSVPRFTLMQKTRNAAVELGADSTMGMGGEYLGQWASKEPGEDWDWDAIAAEGLIGVGPGALGAALEMRGPRANYFGNAPIEIAGEQQTETGTSGTVTRAGYSAPYQTFNDAESMMGHLASFPGVNPETLEFTQKWVDTMYRIRPEQMSKLKIAVSPRTPDANLKNRGTFESRDGHDIMYLNEQEFAADPLGTFMHESGHFARIMILNDEQLMKIWNDLGEPAQKDAYTQYYTKVPEATFDSLSDSEKKKVERAFKRTDNDILAEEWFSYQWARVLTGYKVDKNVANPLKNFKNKVIHPLLGPYIGSESVAGSTGDKGYVIDQQILDFLGYENGMPDPKTPDSTDAPASSVPESKEAMEAKLKAAPGKPADKVKIAKTLNAMAGEKLLSTDISFYTRMERGSVAALGADSEERNKKEQSELEKVEAERLGKSELSNEDKKNLSETKREEYFETKADKKEALRKKLPIANSKKASEKVRAEARAEADKIKSDLDKLDDRVDQEISAEMRDAEIKSLDRLIPATKAEITRLFEAVVETKNKFKSVDNLNIEINRAIRNLGPDASTGQIIAEVLNLKKLLKLAPASFISEFEKRVNPSQKNNRSNEIGDMAAEAHEKIDDYKEALRNRILEIDKQIDSLQKELDKNPPAQDDAPAAFEFNKTQKRKGYLNNAVKLNYTGKPILAYPAFISEKLADYNFALKKADKVGSEGSGWVVIEVSSGKVLNGKKLQRDTRDDAIKAVRDFIDSDEKVGVIQGVGKKTKGRPEEVSDGNRIDSEIEELQEKKVLANRFLQLVAPEEIAIDWKDLPVANHFYRDGLKFAPITLGMLADNSKKISYQIFLKTDKGYKKASAESRTGQEFLWDFLKKFNPKTAPNEAGALGYYGKYSLKPKDYVMALEAVKASAMFPKQKAIGLKPKGQARYEKIDGQNVESSKGYPAGYQSEKGGTLAAIIAERLTKSKKLRVGTPALSLNPTVEEILALKAANGRSLELLGDPSDSERDFNNLIASLLGYGDIKDGEGEYAEIEDYARTANEQISNGTPVVEALLNIPSIVQRKKFEAESREADSKSAMSENSDIKPRGNEIFIKSGFAVPPERDYNAVRVLDSKRGAEKVEENYIHDEFTRGKIFETFDVISSYVKGRTEEELKAAGLGWVKKGPKFDKNRTNIQKSEEMPDRPLLDTGEKADIKSTTDVSAADFAKWYLSEGPDAKKNKSQRKNRRGEKDQRDLTRTQKRLRDLQALPSSKDGKQLPGGLGEGLLPYVFVDFARAMFTKLNLKYSFDTLLKDARDLTKKSDFKWNYERGTMLVDGKPSDEFKPFIKEEERLTPEGMDILAQPIVQAVIDAEGVDIYNQLEPGEESMRQRDTSRGEQQEDNSAEMGDDSGETEQSFTEDPKAVALEQRQKDLVEALEAKPDALKDKSKVSDELLEEVYYSGTSPEIVEAAREELDRRGVKGIRTLNSDAKILTSDADPNLSKLGILARIAGGKGGEHAEEFQKWMDAKKQSIKTGSFKMNFVDRADPLKQFHRGIVNVLKKVGIDENHPLYEQLNVHGRLHQYFGSGYETVEQAELNFINPIKDLLREHNIKLKTFGEYLLARAAPSRNLQIKARADELLADIKKEEKEGEASAKYKAERAKYYDKDDNFLLSSGIDEATAIEVVKKLEANSNFKKFAEKALPIYYRMNLSTLDTLSQSDMIQEPGEKGEGKPLEGFKEKTAMIKAASRFPWAKHSSIKLPDDMGNYSYAPMQGFEGETQNYLDGEAAWEEFGAAGTGGSGKGFDQPKSRGILGGAFGRSGAVGPDPNTVFAVSVNQYFNNNILAAKNEVAKSFGSMFEAIRELTHPQKESDKNDPESTRQTANPEFQGRFLSKEAEGLFKDLSKLDEGMVKELKDEFDKIFEPDYKMVEGKKLYEYPDNGNKLVMTEKQLSTVYKNDPLTFVYRRDGEARLIKFKGTPEGLRMADTMKNLRYESLPSILQFFNKGTRFMARMFTSMNPAFIIPNFFRDLGTAAIHLTEDGKKKMFKDAVNMKNIGSFAKAIFKTEQMIANGDNPNKNPEVQKLLDLPVEELAKSKHPMAGIARYQKAKQSGAKIGYFRHESVPELIRGIQKDLKKSKKGLSKKGLAKLGSFVDSSNTAIENSIRMSTFWAAIKNGYNQDQAAVIARNVTVDFNQKGNLTQALGSLYVFFGASMNSMHRFVTSWNRRSTEDKIKMFGGIAAASMTIALFNRLVDDDEDEEMPDYDTISSYKRDTNFILPLPAGLPEFFNDEKDTGYFSIPLPLGYNVFWTLGQVAADMFAKNVLGRGGEGFVGGSTRIMDSAMNAFNPIGGATIATIGTPSLVTPLVELYANKNFMGRPIRYDDQPFEVPKPAYMQDPKSTPKHWNDLSKAINSFMGGSETVKGSVKGMFGGNPLMYSSDEDIQFDLSGNEMRHAILGYLGGPGQIVDSMLGAMITGAQGESSIRNINDIPMINRFLRATTYGSQTRDTFYGLRDAIKTAEKAVKTAKEISPQAYASVLKDNKSLLQLSSQISALDKQKNKLRRLRNKIEASKALSEEQKTQRVDEIQKKELNLMVAVIKKAQSLGIS